MATKQSEFAGNPLERKINYYLTKQFIWDPSRGGIPADECLYAAKRIIKWVRDGA